MLIILMTFFIIYFGVFLEALISIRSIRMFEKSEIQNDTLYVAVCFGSSKVSSGDESVL